MAPENTTPAVRYRDFIRSKAQISANSGFAPTWIPDALFDFQKALTEYAIRKGRAALFEGCGLGKSFQLLVYAQNVIKHTNKPALVLTPLGVSFQMIQEAEKFGVDAERSQNGKFTGKRVVVTNYERLHHFNPDDFGCVIADEAGCLKDFDSKTTAAVTEFLRTVRYRLLCTATPSPNDFVELGTAAEALGELGFRDMAARFFRKQVKKDSLGWGRTKYELRPHAEAGFWRWVCSWARACRKPSDLGFEDGAFVLPPLNTQEHQVKASTAAPGRLFDVPAESLPEQQEEQRRTVADRCKRVAELVAGTDQPAVCWVHRNDEGDLLERLIPDAVQVSGADPDEVKEERFLAFSAGQVRVLVIKPVIGAWGLNWQHCAHQTYFPSHSFEQYFQGVRRCWRFGQKRPVKVDVVTTDGGTKVLDNLKRKEAQAERMFDQLVRLMNDAVPVGRTTYGTKREQLPSWLSSSK